jgi:adenine-specific DNA methylase
LPTVQGTVGPRDEDLRKALLKFIGNFAGWDLSTDSSYLAISHELVQAAHGEEPPLVVDPFAGGGSILLESLRLGCEAFASDLNPVACLILKAKLNDIPLLGDTLRERLTEAATHIGDTLRADLRDVYPTDPDGSQPIAYIWSRTVRCEAPNCGSEIPLKGSFWLTKKAGCRRALRYKVDRQESVVRLSFEVFEPKSDRDVPPGTVTRAMATCPSCGGTMAPERVRHQLCVEAGGADVVFDQNGTRIGGATLLAVVTVKPGQQGRHYRGSTPRDYEAAWKAHDRLPVLASRNLSNGLSPIPDEPLPPIGTLGFRVQRYGTLRWRHLFTKRQLLTLSLLASRILETHIPAIQELLALTLSKLAERNNVLCNWMVGVECPGHLFTQQVLPPSWDFAEAVPLGDSSGSFDLVVKHTVNSAIACLLGRSKRGDVHLRDAQELGLPDESSAVVFTDPPYYDSIPYSDLSDFFYVWLKRALPKGHSLFSDPFDPTNELTPKTQELVQDEAKKVNGQPKDKVFWQQGMTKAFVESRRVLRSDGIACVVFAHKTTEGWEALLEGMIAGGWVVTGSWPITTERAARVRARDSAALASSIHLICRPRPREAAVGDWNEVLHGNKEKKFEGLSERVANWMERLQAEGIRGADLVFACIGPALEIFSRYTKVETADGREVGLPEYLEKVWEVVGRSALAQVLGTAEAKARNGAAGAVEEDARLTALFLWTLQSTNGEQADATSDGGEDEESSDEDDDEDTSSRAKAKGFTLVFDVVRRFAQPLGIELPKWEGRVIETKKGVVRLLPIAERAKQLFGEDGAHAVAARLEQEAMVGTNPLQGMLFPNMRPNAAPAIRGRGRIRGTRGNVDVSDESLAAAREATTLDRVHAAMLLQAGGRTNALRALLKAEQERGPDFLRLANALSALYPKGSEEKRLLDAMLLVGPR